MALQRFEPVQQANGVNEFHHVPAAEKQQQEACAGKTAVGHVLVALRAVAREREAVAMALRMAAAHRARVTLLHVLEPAPQRSFHWLDGIEKVHEALSRPARSRVPVFEKRRSEMSAFLDSQIPRELRAGVEIHCECRIGDVASEIARFAKEQTVDLVLLCNCPSAWRFSLWPGISRQVARQLPSSVVLAHART